MALQLVENDCDLLGLRISISWVSTFGGLIAPATLRK